MRLGSRIVEGGIGLWDAKVRFGSILTLRTRAGTGPSPTHRLRIVPEVGTAALAVSPRIGHLHVTVDNMPRHWPDASDSHTIIVVGVPPGPHEVRLELADPTHHELGGQTIKFVAPGSAAQGH